MAEIAYRKQGVVCQKTFDLVAPNAPIYARRCNTREPLIAGAEAVKDVVAWATPSRAWPQRRPVVAAAHAMEDRPASVVQAEQDDADKIVAAGRPAMASFASGRYVVRSLLGEGGQKTVYLVTGQAEARCNAWHDQQRLQAPPAIPEFSNRVLHRLAVRQRETLLPNLTTASGRGRRA